MNILFVNYGDFTTNSLNHIGGFANALCAAGHSCAVAIQGDPNTLSVVAVPLFIPTTYEEALAKPAFFPDGRPADIIHAWTPRECVRKFVLAYQPHAHARLVVHLEDNEEFLVARWLERSVESLRDVTELELRQRLPGALAHPRRYGHFLDAADAVTVIVDSLRQFVPRDMPTELLLPGVDFTLYEAAAADASLRRELGLRDDEKVLVFTGSNTFANGPEVRDLYLTVALLNRRGIPTRLVRTGFNSPDFQASLPDYVKAFVLDLGFVEKARLPRLLALADVLVQPGSAGPFNDFRLPSKLPEFLSVGRPVVLPNTNIGRELRDGVDALLVREGSPEEMAAACERIFTDAQLAATLAQNALAFAKRHFDLRTNTQRLAAFYARVRATAPRPGSIATLSVGQTDLSLVLTRLAYRLGDGEPAAIIANLVPLVAALEDDRVVNAERRRLEAEIAEWKKNYELARQHAGNLETQLGNVGEKLKPTDPHTDTLNRELTDVRARLKRLEGKYAISEKLLSSTRRQLDALNHNLATARRELANTQEMQRLTQQHAENLEHLRDTLHQRVLELDQQCHRTETALQTAVAQRDSIIAEREAKIRTLHQSFSWRVTLPLRWLRRKFIDRPRPKPVTLPLAGPAAAHLPASGPVDHSVAPGFPCSVDNPHSWSLAPRKLTVRGWCFADDGRTLTAIRAVLPDRKVDGLYGFKRLDVAASFRGKAQAEHSGWKVEVDLTSSDTLLDLEVRDDGGRWHRFFHTALRIGESFGALDLTSYEKWIEIYDRHSAESLVNQAKKAAAFEHQPLISILMPVYNTPEPWLRRAIKSVREQTYPRWELCIADDASPEPHVRPLLETLAREDSRIKVAYREKNGHISQASNSALELATGEFIGLLDHDDELAPNALFEVAAAINTRPDLDFVYSDEDKIDEDGRRFEPYFKPDWQPDLFLGQNYTSHFSVYRAALVRAAGGFRAGYEGSQDWDLALRIIEQTDAARIVHIPKVLYHWRAIPGSTALQLAEKNYPVEAARRALADHFERVGEAVELVGVPGDHWRVKRPLPDPAPLVSLIIPTRNSLRFLSRCVGSILEKTRYPNYEILIVDNGSDDPETLEYLRKIEGTPPPHPSSPAAAVRVLRYDAPFNYSAINNHGVAHARGTIVGLLNNDLEVINDEWLAEMVSHAVRPEIGCVGAMLYYPNDTIQHAGIVLGVGGVAGHAFREYPRGTDGRFNRARLVQNYSSITAACLVVRKATFEQVRGLDETDLAVAFNDVDFCLKVRAAGYRNLWTPFAELYHHESASRGADDTSEKAERFQGEVEVMLRRWGPLLQRDPAYNPNLTLELNDFSLAAKPRPALLG